MNQRGSAKLIAMVLLLVGAGGGLLYVTYRAAGRKVNQTQVDVPEKPESVMTEEERLAYIEKHLVVTDLQIGPDLKPDEPVPVPGLLRVTGTVTNNGDRKIDQVTLAVYPKDEKGEVIGSYLDNIAGTFGLEPGASREFKFQIPEKKEYAGSFDHRLR